MEEDDDDDDEPIMNLISTQQQEDAQKLEDVDLVRPVFSVQNLSHTHINYSRGCRRA